MDRYLHQSFLLDRNSGKYHEIPLPGGATYIYTLHQEDNGLLYIGTSGSGLFTYDPVKESISAHYHTGNSPLVSNSIYVILPTKDGNILMSTEMVSVFSRLPTASSATGLADKG